MKNKTAGTAAVLLAGTLWGLMGVFVRWLQNYGFSSMHIYANRILTSAQILLLTTGIMDQALKKKFYPIGNRLLAIRLKDIWCFIGTGIISIVSFTICYFSTMKYTSLSVAAVLLYTSPIMVTLLTIPVFREKLTLRKILACLTTFSGCILVTGILGSHAAVPAKAVLLGLLSAFGYALYSIFGTIAVKKGYKALTISTFTFLFAAAGILPFAEFPTMLPILAAHPETILIGVLMGIITTILPYILYTLGLSKIETGKASIIVSAEPVVATLTGVLFFREPLSPLGIAGIFLVLSSVFILNGREKNYPVKQADYSI